MSRLLFGFAFALVAVGCASSRPPTDFADGPFSGPWMLTVQPVLQLGTGDLRTVLYVEPDGDAFEAHSRPGAVPDLVGGFKGWLASVLGGEAYARGALVHIYDGAARPAGDSVAVSGRLVAQGFSAVRLTGAVRDGRMRGELRGAETGLLVATVEGEPFRGSLPVATYAELVPAAREAVAEHYFAPRDLDGDDWTQFWDRAEDRLGRAQDDLEAIAQFQLAAADLGVSHFRIQRASSAPSAEAPPDTVTSGVSFARRTDGVAVLRCLDFETGQATPVLDQAFASMAADPPRALVVDLLACSGGDFSSMAVAAHLLESPVDGGVFVANRWWDRHDALPPRSRWDTLTPLAEPELDVFFASLAEHGALVTRVEPLAPTYSGPVYVLTSGQTASAAEPLAHILKTTGRATLVGAPTAGAMLASRLFPFGDGWEIRVPVADYFTAEGERLEGVGVAPSVEAEPEEALARALGLIE